MVNGNLLYRKKRSWRADELVSRSTLQLLDFDDGSPPEHAWRRKLSSHANRLKEFNVTFREAIRMVWKMQLSVIHGNCTCMKLGLRLWSYIREEASQGRLDNLTIGRKLQLIHSLERATDPQPHKEYLLVGWGVVAFQEALEENSSIGR
ncbi:hypothetical protein U9M48_012624 [Paspalum notatum var. saurae]|uniref:Uncharacterized protein n=1 Tax=Paspalum notatum var. saurae TaxID=547442 RepID=A0AAQ3T0H8_PASNO